MFADLRLAWRRLIKAPGFTVTAVMILTLAIGANAAVFSIADSVGKQPAPHLFKHYYGIRQIFHR